MYSNELVHYGILGMKWGVRRYQNYDGSYTRAGLKRYDKSMENYEHANERYKEVKKSNAPKADVTNARLARKKAERQLRKDYKHLAQDKLGDQGKELYSRGETITGNEALKNTIAKVGGVALSAAAYNSKTNILGSQTATKILAGAGVASMGVASVMAAINYDKGRKLRAYYSHTSNY